MMCFHLLIMCNCNCLQADVQMYLVCCNCPAEDAWVAQCYELHIAFNYVEGMPKGAIYQFYNNTKKLVFIYWSK